MDNLPSISIIIPTLNCRDTLKQCLESIVIQEYPHEKIEFVIADGGSTDGTLELVSRFQNVNALLSVKLIENSLITGEAGKAIASKAARNEIFAFIDSDNILPHKSWLREMIAPFEDHEIAASEPLYYTYRKEDGLITRYCALLGMNDPICLFAGNYDRYCLLNNNWTGRPHKKEDKGSYLKLQFDKEWLPTIGANGFLIRKSVLEKCSVGEYLFDIDIIYDLICTIYKTDVIRFAKVKTGIVHVFSGNTRSFIRKQKRRIKDYLYFNKLGARHYPWKTMGNIKLLRFIFFSVTVAPLFLQSIRGYIKKPDRAWFYHPVACVITLWVYGLEVTFRKLTNQKLERKGWNIR